MSYSFLFRLFHSLKNRNKNVLQLMLSGRRTQFSQLKSKNKVFYTYTYFPPPRYLAKIYRFLCLTSRIQILYPTFLNKNKLVFEESQRVIWNFKIVSAWKTDILIYQLFFQATFKVLFEDMIVLWWKIQ